MTLWINTKITDQSVFYVATFVWLISLFEVFWANVCMTCVYFPTSGCDKASRNRKNKSTFNKSTKQLRST